MAWTRVVDLPRRASSDQQLAKRVLKRIASTPRTGARRRLDAEEDILENGKRRLTQLVVYAANHDLREVMRR